MLFVLAFASFTFPCLSYKDTRKQQCSLYGYRRAVFTMFIARLFGLRPQGAWHPCPLLWGWLCQGGNRLPIQSPAGSGRAHFPGTRGDSNQRSRWWLVKEPPMGPKPLSEYHRMDRRSQKTGLKALVNRALVRVDHG